MPARRVFPMLAVDDLPASLAFYVDVLGGEEAFRFPERDPDYVALRLGESELGIGRVGGGTLHGRPRRPASGHRIELCVAVDDLDATAHAAEEAGAEVVLAPSVQPWGERVAYLADPDGNLVMLTAPRA